jgi:hypothetical protein
MSISFTAMSPRRAKLDQVAFPTAKHAKTHSGEIEI